MLQVFMLLQLSGDSIHFQVLKAMKESDSPRPAVFAMSNPTTKGLCALPTDNLRIHYGEMLFSFFFREGNPKMKH